MITPEHIHLALNHIPFLGAGCALIPLAVGMASRNKNAITAGLLVAALSGWTTPLVMATGEAAYERYEEGPVARYLDPNADIYLEAHEERAEAWAKVIYASAVVSTLCLVWVLRRPAAPLKGLAGVSAVLCLAALVSGIWISQSGGLIRRPDFRAGQATAGPYGDVDQGDYE